MTTNQTIDGVLVSRELLTDLCYGLRIAQERAIKELRALLDAETAPCAKSQVEGKRERFQKWVMDTKHPVYGFLDGRSLARGDDRTGYADEYVQGLWVAYLEFGAEQPAPGAVTAWLDLEKLEAGSMAYATKMRVNHRQTALYAEQSAPVAVALPDRAPNDECGEAWDCGYNACVDEVIRLNNK